jgi:putative membrane protein
VGFEELMQLFRYPANWNLPGNLLTVLVGATYLLLVGPLRRLFPGSTPVRPGKKIWFMSGLLLLYFTLGSPLDLLAHELFSFHMLQMSLLYLVLPPFFLQGIPDWMFRALFRIPGAKPAVSLFTRPIVALFVFNGLLSIYHVPRVFDAVMGDQWLHAVVHILLGIAALFFWWPITAPVEELDRLRGWKRLVYIFAGGALLTPACALIIFSDSPMFALYKEGSALAPILPPLEDQQLGGVLMKIIQEISYGIALGYNFFLWVEQERAKERKAKETDAAAPTTFGGAGGKPQANPQ